MNPLATQYQQYIHLSRYARWSDELGRRETWAETVDRYIAFFCGRFPDIERDVWQRLRDSIYNLRVMPSMRALMTAGKALEESELAGYNCAYRAIDEPHAFDEVLYVLMNGTGVGFSVERQYVSQLPQIPNELHNTDTVIVVRDSKRGWAYSLRVLIALLYNGKIPKWDTYEVRKAGSRLKTFGGRASGPGPLEDVFKYAVKLFQKAAGRRLSSLECHDFVCKIAECVVVGGVRRSALISLSNLSDDRMRAAKSGQWWVDNPERGLANNSACYTERPEIGVFMREWLSLYESKSGERGIFNRQAAERMIPDRRKEYGYVGFGTNPCCVPGDTLILTDSGNVRIDETIGKSINVWNGFEFSTVAPFHTGYQNTLVVNLSDGTSLRCTPNHKFVLDGGIKTARINGVKQRIGGYQRKVLASELKKGDKLYKFTMPVLEGGIDPKIDPYSQGFYSGDGNANMEHSWLYAPKYCIAERLIGELGFQHKSVARKMWKHGEMLPKEFVPMNATKQYKLDWLAGLVDSDGCESEGGLQIASTKREFLADVRLMLTTLGVQAKINQMSEARMQVFADGQPAYPCLPTWRVLINQTDAQRLLDIGLTLSRVQLDKSTVQRDARRFVTVLSIEPSEPCETYCFTEPKNGTGTFNGIVTGQSEIVLRSKQLCNLTEVVVRPSDTIEDLLDKVEVATILGTLQSTLTNFKYVSKKWRENCEEERLLGVSLTGIMDHDELSDTHASRWYLTHMKKHAIETNEKWAKILGINPSAAITCVKPSGTVSQLVDSASGIHPRYAPYYIRTVRADIKDPLATMMADAGVPCEPDVGRPDSTLVFSFPMQAPHGGVFRDDRTAIEQLELWNTYQLHWCEHKPSITVYVREHEWMDVGSWVWKHFDMLSGVSFLPHSDHTYQQAPYQEITREEYERLSAPMPLIDWDKLGEYETDDQTTGQQQLACVAGVCDL
jgi:hypothetical protein